MLCPPNPNLRLRGPFNTLSETNITSRPSRRLPLPPHWTFPSIVPHILQYSPSAGFSFISHSPKTLLLLLLLPLAFSHFCFPLFRLSHLLHLLLKCQLLILSYLLRIPNIPYTT